jgi:NAD(P)-dependent dehydrogenase (short-subunit alcohol dehydrogenase family)
MADQNGGAADQRGPMTRRPDRQVVLLTGASSGLGRVTAALLAERGYRVFGTSRRPSADAPTGVEMLALDVREDQSTADAAESVLTRAGHLDVLISNAGYLLSGAVEETSIDEARAQFETNFFGAVRMVRAVLPAMRAQGGGRIVIIGSLAGLLGVPFEGFYSASKHALEGYSASLRYEVKPFNIQVTVIEPGFFRSQLGGAKQTPTHTVPDYNAARARAAASFEAAIAHGPDPTQIAATIAKVLAAPAPCLHYRVGRDAVAVPRMMALLPQPMFEWGLRRRFRLQR